MKIKFIHIISILLLIIFTGLTDFPAQDLFEEMNGGKLDRNEIVAEVGDLQITADEFFYSYEFGPSFPKRSEDSKLKHLKYMINEKLLALHGFNERVMEDETALSMFGDISADLASEEMFKDEIMSNIKIDEALVDTILQSKLIEVDLKWLFAADKEGIKKYFFALQNGTPFDSLFYDQLNDSVFLDMRSMTATLYSLKKNNPVLAKIVDTLTVGSCSAPIYVNNEWYIIQLSNVAKNIITSESEFNRLKYEAEQAVYNFTMDNESDRYVDELMRNENPVIKKDAFDFLRSYLGKFVLPAERYDEWNLEERLENSLSNLGLKRGDEYEGIELAAGKNEIFKLDEFITWYRNRSLHIKFDKTDLNTFSKSLETLIWRMIRDRLLTERAEEKGYFQNSWVKKQSDWWREKIAYSALKNKIANSLMIENEEIDYSASSNPSSPEFSTEMNARIFRLIDTAKKNYDIVINAEIIDKIKVSDEENRRALDFYAAKKGGLIPRPPYPTIDSEWVNWE